MSRWNGLHPWISKGREIALYQDKWGKYRKPKAIIKDGKKRCHFCEIWKSVDDFYPDYAICKDCFLWKKGRDKRTQQRMRLKSIDM